jgi:hypothetical protein
MAAEMTSTVPPGGSAGGGERGGTEGREGRKCEDGFAREHLYLLLSAWLLVPSALTSIGAGARMRRSPDWRLRARNRCFGDGRHIATARWDGVDALRHT